MWGEMYYKIKWTKQLKLGKSDSAYNKVLTKKGTLLP